MKNFLSLPNKVNHVFWKRISASVAFSANTLQVFRIITGLFLLFIYNPNFEWISQSPQGIFLPPLSFAFFFKNFPSVYFFFFADMILLACTLCIVFGIKTRLACFLYILTGISCFNFQYSFGKIDHDILIFVLLFCLSFSGWGKKIALIPDKNCKYDSAINSLSLLSFILCFAFFSAGFEKMIYWINFDMNKSGSASWFYPNFFVLHRNYLLAPFAINLPFWVFKLMDFFSVIFELSPIFFLLYSAKAWRLWLLLAALFHLINALILNIPFITNAIVYLAFINYSWLFKKLIPVLHKKHFLLIIILVVFGVVVIRVYNATHFIVSYILFIKQNNIVGILYFSLILWCSLIALFTQSILKEKSLLKVT